MKTNKPILPITLALAACAFGTWVWPTSWRHDQVSGRTVRTNRFTGRVQYLTLSGWESNDLPAQPVTHGAHTASTDPTNEQLAAVDGKLGFKGPANSEFGGELYNSSVKPIAGIVVFHIIVKGKGKTSAPEPAGFVPDPTTPLGKGSPAGKTLADRRIQEQVNWAPQHASYVSIKPAWQFDPDNEAFEWHIEPVGHGEVVYKAPGVEVFRVWRDSEYLVALDGKEYSMPVDTSKKANWASREAYAKMISEMRETIKNGSMEANQIR